MDEYCGYDVEDIHGESVLDEVMCEVCGTIQPAVNKFCIHCGEDLKKEKAKVNASQNGAAKKIVPIICVILAAVAVLAGYVVAKGAKEAERKTDVGDLPKFSLPEEKIPEITEAVDENNGIYPMGKYEVGVDIPVGEYLLLTNRLAENGNSFNELAVLELTYRYEVLYDSWFQYCRYVNLKEGMKIDTSWCDMYDLSIHKPEINPFEHSGMFKVGVDVPSGTYMVKSCGDDSFNYCYVIENLDDYGVYSYSCELFDDDEVLEVTLEDGQYIDLMGCVLAEE